MSAFDAAQPGHGAFDPVAFDPIAFDTSFSDGDDEDDGWNVVGPVAIALPIHLSLVPHALLSGAATVAQGGEISDPAPGYTGRTGACWRAVVTLDGTDVSDIVIDDIRVRGKRGAARVAELRLLPPAGISVSLASWTGREVSIDFAARDVDGSAIHSIRIFSGVVDTPDFDPYTGILDILATDDLPGVINAMTDAEIDALCEGYWSPVVFDPARSRGWQRALDRMSTRPASLDLDAWRQPRVCDWSQGDVIEVTADDWEAGSLDIQPADRAGLVNRVIIKFGYRYPRVNVQGFAVSYSYIGGDVSWKSFINGGNQILTRAAVEAALSSAGATADIAWDPIPGPYTDGDWVWSGSAAADQLCQGFSATCSFDYMRAVQEEHTITVQSTPSISRVGIRGDEMHGALEGAYPDTAAQEVQTWLFKSGANSALAPRDEIAPEAGFVVQQDATLTPETDRAAADLAMETLIAMAATAIKSSHRRTAVSCTLPCAPVIDSSKRLSISSSRVVAEGGVERWEHVLSPKTGRAITLVSIAISSLTGVVGILHPETPITAPDGVPSAAVPLTVDPVIQYNYGPDEDHEFSIEFPGIEATERAKAIKPIAGLHEVAVAEDLFTVTT